MGGSELFALIKVMQTTLEKSVLATLVYYDILDFPLTAGEVFKFLINPERFGKDQGSTFYLESYPHARLSLAEVLNYLGILVEKGKLEELNGFYFLSGRENLYQERIEKNKMAEEKWKRTRRYLFLAQAIPYIEAVFASGSLALGHTGEESDLDVLVVVKAGRIWLARVLLSLAMSILGVRRKKKERTAPNKICLNHYIATDSLRIPFESLYTAQSYAHLVPLYWKNKTVVENFWKANRSWVEKFLCRWDGAYAYQRRAIRSSRLLEGVKLILEKTLNRLGLADWLEKVSRKIQLQRINLNLPGRITANDRQLEFHPYSIEKDIIKKYNLAIFKLGIFGNYQELDSGLR